MKNKYLWKLAFNNIVKKKQRTFLHLISVSLVVAILCTTLNITFVLFNTINTNSLDHQHYIIYENEEKALSSHYNVTKDYITRNTVEINNNKYQLHTVDNENVLPFTIQEGQFPNTNSEILVPESLGLSLNDFYQHYKVVGIYKTESLRESIVYTKDTLHDLYAYYIIDNHIEWSTSLSALAELFDVSETEIRQNLSLISRDILKVYVNNPMVFLPVFICVFIIAIIVTFISLKNVYLISNQSRRKEIGLLKSIGASIKQIKTVLACEFIFLGFLGSVLGCGIAIILSSGILSQLLEKTNMTMNIRHVMNVNILMPCIVFGCVLVYASGMINHRSYFKTVPIDDLKEEVYDYPTPVKTKSLNANQFSWRMFLIYNSRLRFQTKNVRQSFCLLLIASIIFCYVVLFSQLNQTNEDYLGWDIEINNISYNGQYSILDFDFMNELYDEITNGDIAIDYIIADRQSNQSVLTSWKSYITDEIENMNQTGVIKSYYDLDNVQWYNRYFYHTLLDSKQLALLESYVVRGDFENVVCEDDFICILSESSKYSNSPTYMCTLKNGSKIGLYPKDVESVSGFISNHSISNQGNVVQVLIHLPRSKKGEMLPVELLRELHLPFENTGYIIAQSYETLDENKFYGTETIKIKLKNSALTMEFLNRIDELLISHHVNDLYAYEQSIYSVETKEFTNYLFTIFLYPIFALLFMISIFNIYNVFKGNILVKNHDIQMLRVIGMGYKQIKNVIIFEYLEGYINASFIVCMLFALCCIAFRNLEINQVLMITDNLLAVLMMSILVVGPILILPLCCINCIQLKKEYRE